MRILLGFVFCCTIFFTSCTANPEIADIKPIPDKFQLIIEAEKSKYKIGEPIIFKCRFINNSNEKQVIHTSYERDTFEISNNIHVICQPELASCLPNLPTMADQARYKDYELTLLPNSEWVYTEIVKFNAPGEFSVTKAKAGKYEFTLSYFVYHNVPLENQVLSLDEEILRSNTVKIHIR